MYLKLRAKTGGGHTHVTFFMGQGSNYTLANCGTIVVNNKDLPAFLGRIKADVIEDVNENDKP